MQHLLDLIHMGKITCSNRNIYGARLQKPSVVDQIFCHSAKLDSTATNNET
jgi:hypothetical protein